jgi:hypothetical protein
MCASHPQKKKGATIKRKEQDFIKNKRYQRKKIYNT